MGIAGSSPVLQRSPGRVLCLVALALGVAATTIHLAGTRSALGAERDLTAEHLHMLAKSLVGDEEIARVANPEEVRELYLSRTNITDRGLALMPRFVNLETLNLRFCDGITDAGIAHLAELRDTIKSCG